MDYFFNFIVATSAVFCIVTIIFGQSDESEEWDIYG